MSSGILSWWRADREYARAFRLLRAGRPKEAVKAFDEVLAIFPKHARAEAQRARALAAAGRTADGIKAARHAAELAPKSHVPPLFLGQIQYDAERYQEARKAFETAAERDPENQLVQAYLGLTQLALGKVEEAAALLDQHLSFGYEQVEGRVMAQAEQYLWSRRERAKSLEQQLTAEEGGREEAPAGVVLRSISLLRSVLVWPLARLRGKVGVLLLRAEEAMSISDFAAAIEAYQAAEAAGAAPEAAALSLGQAYYEAGKPEAAAEQLQRLPEEERQDPGVAGVLGAALLESGRYEQAREYLTIAATRFRKEFAPAYYLGLCELARGRAKDATRWFVEAADRLNPEVAKKRLGEMVRVWREERVESRE
jgi:tetratricopeptide (TPR) repeat protein